MSACRFAGQTAQVRFVSGRCAARFGRAMKILVTGGAGFIGGNFVYHLLRGHPEDVVVCADKLTYAGDQDTLAEAFRSPQFVFYRADIAKKRDMEIVFGRERPDAVVNFAAESHVDRSVRSPSVFLRTNVLGVQVLLDACLKYNVPRFHQVSTDEVYGDLPLEGGGAFSENSPLRPSSPYAASKAAADLLALSYRRTYGLNVTVSRCSNNYGRFQFPEKLIPLAIARTLAGKPVPVYGTGKNVRDWIAAEDHCAAIDLILRKGKSGSVYNVGARAEKSNLELLEAVFAALGGGKIEFVKDRAGHDLRYAVDPSKIESELGWRAKITFAEGIRKTAAWYLSERNWLENIENGTYKESALRRFPAYVPVRLVPEQGGQGEVT